VFGAPLKNKQEAGSRKQMPKEDLVKVEGVVTEVLPSAMFRVKLDVGSTILAYVSGKMRKFDIKITMGDRVAVEISPYDLQKGRIVRRK